jgi:hypothetical protein
MSGICRVDGVLGGLAGAALEQLEYIRETQR